MAEKMTNAQKIENQKMIVEGYELLQRGHDILCLALNSYAEQALSESCTQLLKEAKAELSQMIMIDESNG